MIGNDNPVLADWYPLTKCEAITCSHCGLTLQFESQLLIWVFPQNTMELQNDLVRLCPSLIRTDELHFAETSSSEVLMKLPLKAAGKPFMHQPGVVLHFSGETDDRLLVVWPWGKGKLLEFIETLRKPWESLFSIPMETIAAQ
ncbi:hypothetical protein J437_LFUL017676 [Ladona fulva]|uniref:Uncharacterized protein n=1 Tax=Ladona fulva TaxID=123851 RepID=A0A8K0KTW6_LADFU|nr:hypothetical protein J437_LFUL017676 [Ladona fulva]